MWSLASTALPSRHKMPRHKNIQTLLLLAGLSVVTVAFVCIVYKGNDAEVTLLVRTARPPGEVEELEQIPESLPVLVGPADTEIILPHSVAEKLEPSIRFELTERALRIKLHEARKELSALHCQLHGLGPTGGFCLNRNHSLEDSMGVGGNAIMDPGVCEGLSQLFANTNVGDFGCGFGQYGRCLTAKGRNISWSGYDGSVYIEEVTRGAVTYMDLTLPQDTGVRYDWVMSLEVGEHIPAAHESVFLHNLVRHAAKGVVMSWAVPGQPGHHHVNNHPNDYVVGRMRRLGFGYDREASERLRQLVTETAPWFRNTLMVFTRLPHAVPPAQAPPQQAATAAAPGTALRARALLAA